MKNISLATATLAAAAIIAIGSFSPWVKVAFASASGMDGTNDGWITLAAALLGAAGVAAYHNAPRAWVGVSIAVFGGVATYTGVHDAKRIMDAPAGKFFETTVFEATVGWGLWLTIIGSIAMLVLGVLLAVDAKHETTNAPPLPAEPRGEDGAFRSALEE